MAYNIQVTSWLFACGILTFASLLCRAARARVAQMLKSAQAIHACPSGCMIYWGNRDHLTQCDVCHRARFDPDAPPGSRKPRSVFYYFSLRDRIKQLLAPGSMPSSFARASTDERSEGRTSLRRSGMGGYGRISSSRCWVPTRGTWPCKPFLMECAPAGVQEALRCGRCR